MSGIALAARSGAADKTQSGIGGVGQVEQSVVQELVVAAGTAVVVGLVRAVDAPIAADFAELEQTALPAAAGAVEDIVGSAGTLVDTETVATAELLSGDREASLQWPSCHRHYAQRAMR